MQTHLLNLLSYVPVDPALFFGAHEGIDFFYVFRWIMSHSLLRTLGLAFIYKRYEQSDFYFQVQTGISKIFPQYLQVKSAIRAKTNVSSIAFVSPLDKQVTIQLGLIFILFYWPVFRIVIKFLKYNHMCSLKYD